MGNSSTYRGKACPCYLGLNGGQPPLKGQGELNSHSGRLILVAASLVALAGVFEIGAAVATDDWPSPWLIGIVLTAVAVLLLADVMLMRRFEHIVMAVDVTPAAQAALDHLAEDIDQRFDAMLDTTNGQFTAVNRSLNGISSAVAAHIPAVGSAPVPRGRSSGP